MIQLLVLCNLDICGLKNWQIRYLWIPKTQQSIMPFPRIKELIQVFAHFYSFLIKNSFVYTFEIFNFSKTMTITISWPNSPYQGWIGEVLSVYLVLFHQVFSKILNFEEKCDFFLVGGSSIDSWIPFGMFLTSKLNELCRIFTLLMVWPQASKPGKCINVVLQLKLNLHFMLCLGFRFN